MSNFKPLISEIDSYLNSVQDWDDNLNEHILYMSSIENWSHEQKLRYIQTRELEFRRQGEEILHVVLNQLSRKGERNEKLHFRLSDDDKSNLLSVDLDKYWVNSDTFSRLHREGHCEDKLRCIFSDLEDEVVHCCGTYVFDSFISCNPEIESWLTKWKGIILDRYHGDRFKKSSSH